MAKTFFTERDIEDMVKRVNVPSSLMTILCLPT